MNTQNFLLNSDTYKVSQYLQYPPNTTKIFSYIESRGGKYDNVVFFGLQAYLKEYLSKPITQAMIDEADSFISKHVGPNIFNREGWEYILNTHNGYLPLVVRAVPEGTVVPNKNILVAVENTDPKCFWLTSYIETSLLRAVWYPSTVATFSKTCKDIIKKYMVATSDNLDLLNFKLVDFGARGVSSFESAGLGGAAHLVNFAVTDTMTGILTAQKYYNTDDMVGFSIPAMEHSTVTSWGREHEVDSYRNMLKQFAKPNSIVACVSDSYDIFNAVENLWGKELKEEVIESGATVVIRPDSGEPAEVVWKLAHLLADAFGYTYNSKGYKVLNHVRIIQGDGINEIVIEEILAKLRGSMFSADNITFGCGGKLLQACDRDTLKWAMKCSAAEVDGQWRDVFKQPITDQGKTSKKGRITLYRNKNTGEYLTAREAHGIHPELEDALVTVFVNGDIVKEYSFNEVRENSNK